MYRYECIKIQKTWVGNSRRAIRGMLERSTLPSTATATFVNLSSAPKVGAVLHPDSFEDISRSLKQKQLTSVGLLSSNKCLPQQQAL